MIPLMTVSRYYDVKRDERGKRYLEPFVQGSLLLGLPLLNKGTAYTHEERKALKLEELLPPHVTSLEEQKERNYRRYRLIENDLEKHIFLRGLQDRNEVLFFALFADHMAEMLPILYTPTVGDAVKQFSHIYRYPRGFAASTDNIGQLDEALGNTPINDVRLAVATDSSAILGIGDQGFGGLAISIGKLAIYTAAGGLGPDKALPVELDVGTNRADLINDPLYLGVRHRRLSGDEYYAFMDRFVEAFRKRFPNAVMQWEDFGKDTAFAVLERYRHQLPSFNDDIQGTGAVTLAGVLSACRIKGEKLSDQRILVYGAGAGGAGVAQAMLDGLMREGLSEAEALERVFVLDSKGLLLNNRSMEEYKLKFAKDPAVVQDWPLAGAVPTLYETIVSGGITVLLGLSGQPGSFTEPIVQATQANAEHPVIFPLSNPTSSSEAIPEEILRWTGGKALVAAGSPFAPVELGGKTYPIGQGNNAFIFPGLGFGTVLSKAKEVSDGMVLEASYALYDYTSKHHPARVYPPTSELREVSQYVAARVIRQAIKEGLTKDERIIGLNTDAIQAYVAERFWQPRYLPFKSAE